MHVHKKDRVSKTKEEEIAEMEFKHVCPECNRDFPTKRGLDVHQGRRCDGGKTIRSRTGSLDEKAVQKTKRKAKEADRPHISLDNVQIENVHQFVYLGSCFQSDGDSMADVNHRMNLAQTTFSELHHLWRDHRLPTSLKIRLYQSTVEQSTRLVPYSWM